MYVIRNNVKYAGKYKFKVFMFGATGQYKPMDQWGLDEYDTPIIIYHVDEHFHGVQKPGNLFGKPFCLSCYDRASAMIAHQSTMLVVRLAALNGRKSKF